MFFHVSRPRVVKCCATVFVENLTPREANTEYVFVHIIVRRLGSLHWEKTVWNAPLGSTVEVGPSSNNIWYLISHYGLARRRGLALVWSGEPSHANFTYHSASSHRIHISPTSGGIQALQQGSSYTTCAINVPMYWYLQATQFAYNLADVRRLENSIANAIVNHFIVGRCPANGCFFDSIVFCFLFPIYWNSKLPTDAARTLE